MPLFKFRRTLLVVAALAASAVPFVADVGVAQAAVTSGYAILWADQPTAASYTPNTSFQHNSMNADNTIVRNGVGNYTVTLPGLGGDGGNVQVTAYGSSGTQRCKVASWYPYWLAQTVNVRCHATSGAASDSMFTLQYQANGSGATFYDQGYVWANSPTTASYTAPAPYSWNSRGGTNTIQRVSTGRYRVTFPLVNMSGGNVQVTAYGTGSEYCNVVNWGGGTADIACYTRTGAAVDTQFSASYTITRMPSAQVWTHGFYMWNQQTGNTAWHTPAAPYAWTSRTTMQTRKVSTGVYEINVPNQAFTDAVPVVVAYNTNKTCRISHWNSGVTLTVRCFTPGGSLSDSQFSVLYNSNFTV
jgi:hypothetical protein